MTYTITDMGGDPPYGPTIVIEDQSATFPDDTAAAAFAEGVIALLGEHTNQSATASYRMTQDVSGQRVVFPVP